MVQYTWTDRKARANRAKHALPFELASRLFDGVVIEGIDDRFDYGETRIIAVGMVDGRVLVCVYADHGDERRVISLRKATRNETQSYFETLLG